MPTVDLTPRLVRDSSPGAGDTILFDRALPGFGLRIHPSGRKVYIVQARIRVGGNPAEARRRVRRTRRRAQQAAASVSS